MEIVWVVFICVSVLDSKSPNFLNFFGHNFFPRWAAPIRLVSKDVELSGASFDLCKKFARRCSLTQTPTQKIKIGFWILNFQGISSLLISLRMIFKVLQLELFGFKFQSLGSKILKIPEFNLIITISCHLQLLTVTTISFTQIVDSFYHCSLFCHHFLLPPSLIRPQRRIN